MWVGHTLFSHDTPHAAILRELGVPCRDDGVDGSNYQHDHQLSSKGEPICFNEYAAEIAANKSTHVIFISDYQEEVPLQLKTVNVNGESDFHELILQERAGRERLTYIYRAGIDKIYSFFKEQCRELKKQVFLLPQDLHAGSIEYKHWSTVQEPSQLILDLRQERHKKAAREHGPQKTFKSDCEIW